MGNTTSGNSAQKRAGSGKLVPKTRVPRGKDKRSCSDQMDSVQMQAAMLRRNSRNNCNQCCTHCGRHQTGSGKRARAPRRLAKKASEGAAAAQHCCASACRIPQHRMAEDTVAISRTTVRSAMVEERVALAAVATAVRWRRERQDMNCASLHAAGAVLKSIGGGVPQKVPQKAERKRASGSTRSDRTPANGGLHSPPPAVVAVASAGPVDRPAPEFAFDGVSLDDERTPASGRHARLLGVTRQRLGGASFDARRAKSFRYPAGASARCSARAPAGAAPVVRARTDAELGAPCPVTGLTLAQKRLVLARWRQLGWTDMLRLAEQIFERTFRRNESFARPVLRMAFSASASSQQWRAVPAFRVHTLRFCHALAQLCAGLEDAPALGAELLAELGAQHALLDSASSVPDSYWDVLVQSMCEAAGTTAADGQPNNGTECFAPAGCSISPASSSGISSGCSSCSTPVPPPPLLPQWTRRAADAWAQLAVFVSARMRHGYEMERYLQACMRRRMQESRKLRRRSLSASGSLAARKREPSEPAKHTPDQVPGAKTGSGKQNPKESSGKPDSEEGHSGKLDQGESSSGKPNPEELPSGKPHPEELPSGKPHPEELPSGKPNPEEGSSGKPDSEEPSSGRTDQEEASSGKPHPEEASGKPEQEDVSSEKRESEEGCSGNPDPEKGSLEKQNEKASYEKQDPEEEKTVPEEGSSGKQEPKEASEKPVPEEESNGKTDSEEGSSGKPNPEELPGNPKKGLSEKQEEGSYGVNRDHEEGTSGNPNPEENPYGNPDLAEGPSGKRDQDERSSLKPNPDEATGNPDLEEGPSGNPEPEASSGNPDPEEGGSGTESAVPEGPSIVAPVAAE